MSAAPLRLLIGYGSESGNARTLAQRLGALPALQAHAPQVAPLNTLSWPDGCAAQTLLIIISSSFGDGDPPGNAELFYEQVQQADTLAGLPYAIFGLGDTAYPHFCGFTQQLDACLQAKGAQPWLARVDADAGYEDFFTQWTAVLQRVLAGDREAGHALSLRVQAYGAQSAFPATLLERHALSQSHPAAWHLRLDIRGSAMHYRAGDTLYVLPENDPALLQALADWYGDTAAAPLLADRELRQLGKSVLRGLARLSQNAALQDMLKNSQRKALEAYLWGADILDVLQDFCTPANVPLAQLAELLPELLPRAYSIASAGGAHIDLCVRDVDYVRQSRQRRGCATRWLLHHNGPIRVFCRANPGFHLPADPATPLLLIGTGTGIAPLMGLLRTRQQRGPQAPVTLIFGEKHPTQDFLYRDELQAMLADGTLTALYTAFSRQGPEKYYVQHAIAEHAAALRTLLQQGAHLYLCGNKQHLEPAVAGAINTLLGDEPALNAPETAWQGLARQGRLHRELY